MLYFVKDRVLHRFPAPKSCGVQRTADEKLRDTIPHDIEECIYCLKNWPGKND